MPEVITPALATPGLGWMMLAILAAGLVRGFTGFGTALIFVPVAGQFLPGPDIIMVMAITGLFSMMALLPNALKTADRGEVGTLAFAAALSVPVGVWMLAQLDGLTIRWIVSGVVALTLLAVITGWRWHGRLGWPGRFSIGGGAGLVGGLTGLTGPVVIIFYLANARSAAVVRSNTIVFLAVLDVVLVANLAVFGHASAATFWIAVIMGLPYLVTTLIGQALFDPKLEKTYRYVAYGVIGLALVSGLPLLD
jgi:uncharacterized membrane protein YfcA